jgi:hypothetical protein
MAFRITAVDKGGETPGKKIVGEFSIPMIGSSNGKSWSLDSSRVIIKGQTAGGLKSGTHTWTNKE